MIETIQLLVFTGLGFWLLVNKLGGEATITLDTDWLYRRPSRLVYNLCVVSTSCLFATVESLTIQLARFLTRLGANPIGYLVMAKRFVGYAFFGAKQPTPEPLTFDPGRYRISLGAMVLLVILCIVILIVLGLSKTWH